MVRLEEKDAASVALCQLRMTTHTAKTLKRQKQGTRKQKTEEELERVSQDGEDKVWSFPPSQQTPVCPVSK